MRGRREDAWKQRQIACAVMLCAKPIPDGGLALSQAVEVAHRRRVCRALAYRQEDGLRAARGSDDRSGLSLRCSIRPKCSKLVERGMPFERFELTEQRTEKAAHGERPSLSNRTRLWRDGRLAAIQRSGAGSRANERGLPTAPGPKPSYGGASSMGLFPARRLGASLRLSRSASIRVMTLLGFAAGFVVSIVWPLALR